MKFVDKKCSLNCNIVITVILDFVVGIDMLQNSTNIVVTFVKSNCLCTLFASTVSNS